MLTEHFMKYGRVITAQVMRDYNSGRSRGFGFVTLYIQENTENLFSDEHNVNGKHVDVRRMQNDAASNMKRKIFVGGLPKSLSEQMLKTFFERFGAVEKVTIMRQYDGSSRGFGFVIFAVDGAVEKVPESPSHFVYGSKVDVRAAESRSKQAAARLENQYKNMMRHGYNADYGTDRTMALQSPYGNTPKVAPASMPSPVVPYDAQYYQQQLLYQQYALQSQYAYYAQQSGSGSGTTDPSRYVTQRPNTFGQQPNSQNNIARMYRSKPY
uniref:RNA recognition motif domain containing protein n=1 Tax=Babesia bovis TaxID=5865 RepID=S6BNH8_BABBO|nr:RNA recognition motif domain containing protein [Babesia bovis]